MRALVAMLGLVVVNVFLLSQPAYAEPMFMGLGFLPGSTVNSWADGVSANGSTVVGYAPNAAHTLEAFRWTSAGGVLFFLSSTL